MSLTLFVASYISPTEGFDGSPPPGLLATAIIVLIIVVRLFKKK